MNVRDSGFLVVLATKTESNRGPATYEGVDRMPGYPGDRPDQTAALDFYVFGECKDPRTNLIPHIEVARDLLAQLSRGGRRYEIILCCEGPDSEALTRLPAACAERLGFDVAAIRSDYWSIVDDFSKSSWAEPFRSGLNEHGLFRSGKDAERYLREYKRRNEADSDSPLEVVYVVRLQ